MSPAGRASEAGTVYHVLDRVPWCPVTRPPHRRTTVGSLGRKTEWPNNGEAVGIVRNHQPGLRPSLGDRTGLWPSHASRGFRCWLVQQWHPTSGPAIHLTSPWSAVAQTTKTKTPLSGLQYQSTGEASGTRLYTTWSVPPSRIHCYARGPLLGKPAVAPNALSRTRLPCPPRGPAGGPGSRRVG